MILEKIAADTKLRVEKAKRKVPYSEICRRAMAMDANTGFPFEKALAEPGIHYICEVKKASPSKGVIAQDFPYLEIAREYEKAGADAISCLTEMLLPLATLITPNIPEAELLTGMTIQSKTDMEQAGRCLYDRFHSQVLIKGGHAIEDASDVLVGTEVIWFHGSRIDNPNTHGTGCTLSSAIACGLAKGYSVAQSISYAKSYLSGALSSGLDLGRGSGPIDHGWQIQENVRSL